MGKHTLSKIGCMAFVFCVATAIRSSAQTFTTLVTFNGTNGADPFIMSLVQGIDGNLYGTSYYGGANGQGVVFRITPSGTLTTLYSFCAQTGCADGANPNPTAGLLQATDGSFYGTTGNGGLNNVACTFNIFSSPNGCGTVFKITPGGTLTTLYRFCTQTGCADGANPAAGLVQATDGNFYGTTVGTTGPTGNAGTVFRITAGGTLTTLYRFCAQTNCTDGDHPFDGLVQGNDGNFYGTTNAGGAMSNGTVFRLTPGGILTTLHSFNGTDGAATLAGLVQGTDGSFYGTSRGGPHGTVFRLSVGLGPFVKTIPTSGAVGAAVIILGNNLTGATSVKFNGTAATFAVVSSSEIQTTVPTGATTGTVQVTTPSGTLNSNVPFQVTKPRKRRAQVTSE